MNLPYLSTDQIPIQTKGFIDKSFILNKLSQEEIFNLVFDPLPEEFEYIMSPFREDSEPGAWFSYDPNGKLFFVDFADPVKTHYDCFNAVQEYYQLPNFYQTLKYIDNRLLKNRDITLNSIGHVERKGKEKKAKRYKNPVELLVRPRMFNNLDKKYWQRYEISKSQLIEDKVFPLSSFRMLNTRKGDTLTHCRSITYCFTDFIESRRKVYQPFAKSKKNRFITNCHQDDIGNLSSLIPFGKQLVISKSYKDCAVLRNLGLNSIWFQSEGVIPSEDTLMPILQRFDKSIVLFDNDEKGIEAAKKTSDIINSKFPYKSRFLFLPEYLNPMGISDPADLVHKKDRFSLVQFLTSHQILK